MNAHARTPVRAALARRISVRSRSMKKTLAWIAGALVACLPLAATAHKMFLVPSTTVLSDGDDAWITVDAAVSNDLFNFNHHALALDRLAITGPDGAAVAPENASTGKWRSVFDVHLTKQGTYRIAVASGGLFANYVDAKGEKKRWRGTVDKLGEIPADAKQVELSEFQATVDTFATLGKPNDTALKPTGKGLELVPVTHPNDLYAGESANFRFLLDGRPAKDLKVTLLAGGTRYRDRQDEITATTDANGAFSVKWPAPGLYWLNASLEGQKPTVAKAKDRRLGYTATLEVLPQ
jgi:hypothetical protein